MSSYAVKVRLPSGFLTETKIDALNGPLARMTAEAQYGAGSVVGCFDWAQSSQAIANQNWASSPRINQVANSVASTFTADRASSARVSYGTSSNPSANSSDGIGGLILIGCYLIYLYISQILGVIGLLLIAYYILDYYLDYRIDQAKQKALLVERYNKVVDQAVERGVVSSLYVQRQLNTDEERAEELIDLLIKNNIIESESINGTYRVKVK